MDDQLLEKETAEEETLTAQPETDAQTAPGEEQPEEPEKPAREPFSLRQFLLDLMDIAESAIVTVFVFQLIFAFFLKPVEVSGGSMNPTLYDSDQLIMLTHPQFPRHGDIVVIDDEKSGHFSDEAQTQVYETSGLDIVIIKRLIGKAGDEINIDFLNGTVSVNGKQLTEPYIKELTTRNDLAFTYPLTVPEGYYFVMGDNRNGSTDSRNPAVALVPEDQLLGVVFMRYGRDEDLVHTWTDRFDWLL